MASGCGTSSPNDLIVLLSTPARACRPLLSTAAAQLPALRRGARQQGSWTTGLTAPPGGSVHGDEARALPQTRLLTNATHWVALPVYSCSLGAQFYSLSSDAQSPQGMALPRASKTRVAMRTAARIHQGVNSQSGLQLVLPADNPSPGCQAARTRGTWGSMQRAQQGRGLLTSH